METIVEEMRVREARHDDREALAQLFCQEAEFAQCLAGYYEIDADFDWTAWVLSKMDKQGQGVLIAEQGEQILGFVHLRIAEYVRRPRSSTPLARFRKGAQTKPLLPIKPLAYGVIESCLVTTGCRRKGIGRRLVTKGLEWFRRRGMHRVELGVLSRDAEAVGFWRQLGFEPFRTQMHQTISEKNAGGGS